MKFAPVALFVFNRLSHTRLTVKALQNNIYAKETDLFIFSDGSKSNEQHAVVASLREYLKTINGFKSITICHRPKNYGLARNITEGVTEIVEKFGRIIVVEDDLLTSPFFLKYMNEGLKMYENHQEVISIVGYTYPTKTPLPETFFIRGADCWGWGTWKRGWDKFEKDGKKLLARLAETDQSYQFDFNGNFPFTQMLQDQVDGKINSWAIRWYASAFLDQKYSLYPGRSLIFNAGADGSGTHVGRETLLDVGLSPNPIEMAPVPVIQSEQAFAAFARFYHKLHHPSLYYRFKRYIKSILSKQEKAI
ncbi:MAG: glycosyltransferase [Chitinophagaceae bacterium]